MPDHVPLSADAHRDLRVDPRRARAFGDAVMSCITVPQEFRRVAAEYPILFRLDYERDTFTALAMFGFEAGENLYLGREGWDARYLPMAMAIQPLLIGTSADGSQRQVHLDAAHPRLAGAEGVRLFDADGRPTPWLENTLAALDELDAGYRATPEFFAALRRHDLLEPLTLEVTLDDGATNRLIGYHVVDEDKLQGLDQAVLGELHRAGHLMPTFMALASLSQLGGLVARKNRRNAGG